MRGSWPRLGPPALALLHVHLLLLLLLHLLVGTEAAFRNGTASRRSGGFRRSSATCAKRMLPEILPLPETCPPEVLGLRGTVYILYDVNISEGFNLRRDVYIRMANLRRRRARRKAVP